MARFKLQAFDAVYERMSRPAGRPRARRSCSARPSARRGLRAVQDHVHRILNDMAHPWLDRFRRPLFWQEWWHFVDIDAAQQRSDETSRDAAGRLRRRPRCAVSPAAMRSAPTASPPAARSCARPSRRRDQLRPGAEQRPVLAHRHRQHLRGAAAYDYSRGRADRAAARPAAMPEVSADFRTLTVRLRPGIRFADDPAFNGRPRELVAADYVYALKRFADPTLQEPELALHRARQLPGLAELREQRSQGSRRSTTTARSTASARSTATRSSCGSASRAPRFLRALADARCRRRGARGGRAYGDEIGAHPVGTGPFRLASGAALAHRARALADVPRRDLRRPAGADRRRGQAMSRASRAAGCRWSIASRSRSSRRASRAGCRSSTAQHDTARGAGRLHRPRCRTARWRRASRAAGIRPGVSPDIGSPSSTWSIRWSAATRRRRSRCGAPSASPRRRGRDPPGAARPASPRSRRSRRTPRATTRVSQRDERHDRARSQRAARHVRLRRPRWRRLARAARGGRWCSRSPPSRPVARVQRAVEAQAPTAAMRVSFDTASGPRT